MNARPLNVAVIGAGPAGIYASDILSKSGMEVCIDLFEQLPAPYGLVRYGVAPDHPRIKQIIVALYKILQRGDIRLIGNVEVGRDISVAELHEHYDAIIFSTGADTDAPLDIPGVDAPECHGGADFVSWYDGHPDHPRTWDLSAKEVAVIGVGNVALDIARVLSKHPADLMTTEIPANVAAVLAESPVTDVHVFGRRGPAQVKFTPLELRELGKQADVDVLVDEEDFEYDEGSQAALKSSNQQRQVVKALEGYAMQEPEDLTASHRIHIHLFQAPAAVLTDDGGHVRALRTERTRLTGDGGVTGTGEFHDWPVQAVYRAVGYASSSIEGLPFDAERHVVPNEGGRVLGEDGEPLTGLYATGWIRRGPVGLIGSTKSDAQETVSNLVADANAGLLHAGTDDDGHVRALRTERTRLTGDGNVTGTGEYRDWPVQAVYRAVGYASSPIEGLPFDAERHVVPNEGGRVLGEDGEPLTGIYATGWIRRGPVGLIGSTKSDAQETIANLVSDASAGLLHAKTQDEAQVGHDALIALLESRGIPFTTWGGWELLDAYERELGESCDEVVVTGGESKPRERVKVVSREAMTAISRSTEVPEDLIGAPEADRVPERVADRLKG